MTAAEAMSRSSAATWDSPPLHSPLSAHDGMFDVLYKLLFELFQIRIVIHLNMEPIIIYLKIVL